METLSERDKSGDLGGAPTVALSPSGLLMSATLQTVLECTGRYRLAGLKGRKDLNGHVVDVVDKLPSGRCRARVLSSCQTISVAAESCEALTMASGPRLSKRDADAATIRLLLEHVLTASCEQELDVSDVVDCILGWLVVPTVDMAHVRAVGASSSTKHGPCDPAHTLDPSNDNWWISASRFDLSGRQNYDEYVEYELGDMVVAVDLFHMTIPPMQTGPLSVRVFHLEVAQTRDGPWERATEQLMTLDVPTRQWWSIVPPIEARYVRVVCEINAAQHLMIQEHGDDAEGIEDVRVGAPCIGFFSAGFAAIPQAAATRSRTRMT